MALTNDSSSSYHTIVLGIIFVLISISSQYQTSNDAVATYIESSERSEMLSSEIIERVDNLTSSNETTTKKCSKYKKLDCELQPKSSNIAKPKKCCPAGESYQVTSKTEKPKCKTTPNLKFNPVIKEVVLYDGCVEFSKNISLNYTIGNPCAYISSEYSEAYNDTFYVIQNGSLLIFNGVIRIGIFDEYCLDNFQYMDHGNLFTAIVCNQTFDQTFRSNFKYAWYAICMLASVPCLLCTVFCYSYIRRLSNIYGKSLACHALCSAIAFLSLGIAEIKGEMNRTNGLIVQYFFLSCYFWLSVMCFDAFVHVWYFIPQKIVIKPISSIMRFVTYATISFGIPVLLVYSLASKKIDGVPTYYFNGQIEFNKQIEEIRHICQYFMIPITIAFFTSFALLIASYFGLRKLDHIAIEVKQTALSTAFLCIITAINRTYATISFCMEYNSSIETFDILNAVHGMVVFFIFVCRPKPLAIIRDWWYDYESLVVRI